VLALTLLIFLIGAIVQSVTGFGFLLVAAPLVAITDGPRTAVVCGTALCLAMTAGRSLLEREHVDWPITGRILGWSMLGMPVGVLLLKALSDNTLAAGIAAIVLGCTVLVWGGWRWRVDGWRVSAVGVLCGLLTTSTGTNGPPLVAALQGVGAPPRVFRATMAALLTATGVVGLALLAAAGATTGRHWLITALGLPVVAIGAWLGRRILNRVNPERFRRLVLTALVTSSAIALAHAATPW